MEKKILLNWLNNAYSMEMGLIQVLEKHKNEAGEHMNIAEMIEEHIKETRAQAEMVKSEIERLGGDVSKLKEWGAEISGFLQGIMSGMFEDKLVKNAIADHAAEHLEMATYKALAKAAEIEGDERVKTMAENIMHQEEVMSKKLDNSLDEIVEMYYRQHADPGDNSGV